jgi:undecaprenyl-diphosphatase
MNPQADNPSRSMPAFDASAPGRDQYFSTWLGLAWCIALGALLSLTAFVVGNGTPAIDGVLLEAVVGQAMPDAAKVGSSRQAQPDLRAVKPGPIAIARRGQGGVLAALMRLVSVPGDGAPLTILGMAAAFVALRWAGHHRAALTLLVVDLAASAANLFVFKPLIARLRPTAEAATPLVDWTSAGLHRYSFPSGHTVHYTVLFGFLVWWAYHYLPRGPRRIVLIGASAAMLVLVGISRVYLGVHWPTDVVAGYLAGGLWLAIAIALMRHERWLGNPRATRA